MIEELIETIEMLCRGLEWHIETHPLIMNQADDEALATAQEVVDRARRALAEREAA